MSIQEPPYLTLLRAGTNEHYQDPILYDYEYRKRRRDVMYYRNLARSVQQQQPLRILELGSGTGRLLLPLVRDGHTVVGIDRSPHMLRRCKQKLSRLSVSARQRATLIQADFQDLPLQDSLEHRFPLILCPFHAFMHLYTRTAVENFLSQVKRLLQPNGLFVFDLLVPDLDWLCKDPTRRFSKTRFTHPTTGETWVYSTNHLYDPVHQIALIRIFYESIQQQTPTSFPSKNKVIHLAHRQFFPAELEALLSYNGFHIVRREGDFDGQAFSSDSQQQIIHATIP